MLPVWILHGWTGRVPSLAPDHWSLSTDQLTDAVNKLHSSAFNSLPSLFSPLPKFVIPILNSSSSSISPQNHINFRQNLHRKQSHHISFGGTTPNGNCNFGLFPHMKKMTKYISPYISTWFDHLLIGNRYNYIWAWLLTSDAGFFTMVFTLSSVTAQLAWWAWEIVRMMS